MWHGDLPLAEMIHTSKALNASKMIMRPERVTEERLDPSLTFYSVSLHPFHFCVTVLE
jgi:hypothetical protein